ncbi:hypothetical protein P171DRAFT_479499 [Karstenula rhodostoma CBS 690.94]|uniref:Uncharacterized protein n=1 Tax=Karstenula rhodostoma CBS 690.94 TaxID=1392251 RepID=A0A9P4UHN3_9PLEO|nr:hypothetical protein P171DRAFT_479499 [Karstenula rhodostoma CBS 690.94]
MPLLNTMDTMETSTMARQSARLRVPVPQMPLELMVLRSCQSTSTDRKKVARNGAEAVLDLTDWSKYGFDTEHSVDVFKNSLQAAQDTDILLDYAIGPPNLARLD